MKKQILILALLLPLLASCAEKQPEPYPAAAYRLRGDPDRAPFLHSAGEPAAGGLHLP